MLTTPAEVPSGRRPHAPVAVSQDRDALLIRSIKAALGTYLKGRKLVRVRVRQVEGSKAEGFLKIEGGKAERLLLDFKATSTSDGELSSLEVGGKKIVLASGAAIKRTH
jgi:hypothetical protein